MTKQNYATQTTYKVSKKMEQNAEILGYHTFNDSIERKEKSKKVKVKQLDFLTSFNQRYFGKSIGTGEKSLKKRIDGNMNAVTEICRKGVPEKTHILIFTKKLVKKINEVLVEIKDYNKIENIEFFNEDDYNCILESFPMNIKKNYLVVDGNSTCAVIYDCYLTLTNNKLSTKMTDFVSKFYEKEQITVSMYDEDCLSDVASFKRDCQILELLSLIVRRNREKWSPKAVEEFIGKLIRISNLIIRKWKKEDAAYDYSMQMELLNLLYLHVLPRLSADMKKKGLYEQTFVSTVQCALFNGDITLEYELKPIDRIRLQEKFEKAKMNGDNSPKITTKVEKTLADSFISLFDVLFQTVSTGDDSFIKGQTLHREILKLLSKFSFKSGLIDSSRDRHEKLKLSDDDKYKDMLKEISQLMKNEDVQDFSTKIDDIFNRLFNHLESKVDKKFSNTANDIVTETFDRIDNLIDEKSDKLLERFRNHNGNKKTLDFIAKIKAIN